MIDDDDDDVPRVLWARTGLEPHSGALGIDVTFLLLGTASTIGLTLLASALLRARRGERVDVIGDPPPQPPAPAKDGAP